MVQRHLSRGGKAPATHAYPIIGTVAVADVTDTMLRVLEPHWTTSTATMRKLRARIGRVLGYAGVKGYRPKGVSRSDGALPAPSDISPTKHHVALKYEMDGRVDHEVPAGAPAIVLLKAIKGDWSPSPTN
jgi:hypothetical protein